jgi:cell division protein FtsZ
VGLDTDAQALERCALDRQFLLGSVLTKGRGAGGDASVGKVAAEEDLQAIRDMCSRVDLLFLVVALGGGTGTGAGSVVARIAREQGALVVCFATFPFTFEGEQRCAQARAGLRELRHHTDALVVQANDRLLESTSEASALATAFNAADAMLGVGVRALWKLLNEPGIINVSFGDVRRVIECGEGTCSFGYGAGHGTRRGEQALEDLVRSPLLEKGAQLAKAGALLINITGGPDLTIHEVQQIMEQIRSLCRSDAHLLLGVAVDPLFEDRVAVTMLAAEQWVPVAEPARGEREEHGPAVPATAPGRRRQLSKAAEKRRELQRRMGADAMARDRFRGVEPTLYHGQDLDIPTFIRKGVKLMGE